MTALVKPRVAAATLGLLAGHVVLAALYWALLNVPESNVTMLAASVLLAVLLVVGAGVVQAHALLRLATDLPWRHRLRRALTSPWALLVALAVWLAVSWVCGSIEAWHEARAGAIDAWFIAHGDWTNIAWLHRTIEWTLRVVRYVIGTSLAVAVLAAAVLGGVADVVRLRWLRPSLAPVRLLVVALVIAGLIWLPWRAAWWRPQFLPANVVEPLFGAAKLVVLAVVMHAGWALILAHAAARYREPAEPPPV